MESHQITFATGCSGIGAPEMAWGERLGWKPLWCSEIEPFPCAVLKYRWPETPNAGDFLTLADRIAKDELEAPDVFIAGTPCQAFSVAGLRKSLNDERGNITIEYIKIANAMDEQRRRHGKPETVFVWENVPGVLSTKDNAFGCFLGGLAGLSGAVAAENGQWNHYGSIVAFRTVAWRILDAQYFGVAQRRRRVFVIGTARPGFSTARRLFECGSVPRPAPPCRTAEQNPAAAAEVHIAETIHGEALVANPQTCWQKKLETIAGTITTQENTVRCNTKLVLTFDIGNGQVDGAMTPNYECANTLHCMHDANAVMCVPINSMIIGKGVKLTDRQTIGIGEDNEPCPTLLSGHGAHAIAVGVENHGQDSRLKECGEIAPTIPGQAGTCGNNVPLCYTVEAELKFGFVRRLTTVECARLQGFPDHHTEIPWRGKPAEKCPRAPQYKAYGNSMCVNVIEWLGRGIAEELANPAPFEIHYPEQQTFNF